MEKALLYVLYIITTTIAIIISFKLLGFRNIGIIGIIIGIINGTNDYLIKEILRSESFFFSGFHIIISIILVSILCYWLLRISILAALIVPILAYIFTALSEIMMLIFMISIFDKSFIDNGFTNIYYQIKIGTLAQLPLVVIFLLLQFKFKSYSAFNLKKFIRKKKVNTN